MNRLVSDDLWEHVRELAKQSSTRRAAIAYVTHDAIVTFQRGDLLIVDASDPAITSGQTSADLLKRALRRGATLLSCPGLHAKLLVLDRHVVIGSANLSESSMTKLIEAALITDQPGVLSMAHSLLDQLSAQADSIDDAFVRRISALPVTQRPIKGRRPGPRVEVSPPRTWLLGIHEVDPARYAEEEEFVEHGLEMAADQLTSAESETRWLRFTGTSRFRREGKPGDSVVQIWRPKGHKLPAKVYKHAPIVHRQDEPNCTRFYVESFADAEDGALRWKDFLKLIERLQLPGRVSPNMARLLPEVYSEAIASLWGERIG